jgi:Flp pilus assembly protein protease CpaA
MGWMAYEGGGMIKALGVLFILAGFAAGIYEFWLGNLITALVAFLGLLVLGFVMISWGSYSRAQNTPLGRVDDYSGK